MIRSTTWIAAGIFTVMECWLLANPADAGLFRNRGHRQRCGGYATCGGCGGGYADCNGGCSGRRHRGWRRHRGYARHANAGCCGPVVNHHCAGQGAGCYGQPAGCYGQPAGCHGQVIYGQPMQATPAPPANGGYAPESVEPPPAPDVDDAAAASYQRDVAPPAEPSPSDVDRATDGESFDAAAGTAEEAAGATGEASDSPPPPPSSDTGDAPPDA